MKIRDIKKMTKDQLAKNLEKYKKDLFNLRFQKINSQLTDVSKFNASKKKYHVHDEENHFKDGDLVTIEETKPYSKKKHFKVLEKNQ